MKTIVSDVRLISENELNHYPTFSFSLAEELEREREKRVWVNDTAHRRFSPLFACSSSSKSFILARFLLMAIG